MKKQGVKDDSVAGKNEPAQPHMREEAAEEELRAATVKRPMRTVRDILQEARGKNSDAPRSKPYLFVGIQTPRDRTSDPDYHEHHLGIMLAVIDTSFNTFVSYTVATYHHERYKIDEGRISYLLVNRDGYGRAEIDFVVYGPSQTRAEIDTLPPGSQAPQTQEQQASWRNQIFQLMDRWRTTLPLPEHAKPSKFSPLSEEALAVQLYEQCYAQEKHRGEVANVDAWLIKHNISTSTRNFRNWRKKYGSNSSE